MQTRREYLESINPEEVSPHYTPPIEKTFLLSTASSIISRYPLITSAYLFGSYAKGTPTVSSDIDIALFTKGEGREKRLAVGGAVLDLEEAFEGKQIDVTVGPPGYFIKRVENYWVKIDLDGVPKEKEN